MARATVSGCTTPITSIIPIYSSFYRTRTSHPNIPPVRRHIVFTRSNLFSHTSLSVAPLELLSSLEAPKLPWGWVTECFSNSILLFSFLAINPVLTLQGSAYPLDRSLEMKKRENTHSKNLRSINIFTDPTAATIQRNYSGLLPRTKAFILDSVYDLWAILSATI